MVTHFQVEEAQLLKPLGVEEAKKLPEVYHGTSLSSWSVIRQAGLCRMSRAHIHFACAEYGSKDVISGARNNCEVLIYVDVCKAVKDGIPFFISDNNVVLSPGTGPQGILPVTYFAKLQIRKDLRTPFEDVPIANFLPKAGAVEQKAPVGRVQSLDYLAVLDFEATCGNSVPDDKQEIIEFPVVLVNLKDGTLVEDGTFHQYVRPVLVPKLDPFCTELTGIEQSTVDKARPFPEVFRDLESFLQKHQLISANAESKAALVRGFVFFQSRCLESQWTNRTALVRLCHMRRLGPEDDAA